MERNECAKIDFVKPTTKVFTPDKSKFKSWEDLLDFLVALGIKVVVEDGVCVSGVDLDVIEKFCK